MGESGTILLSKKLDDLGRLRRGLRLVMRSVRTGCGGSGISPDSLPIARCAGLGTLSNAEGLCSRCEDELDELARLYEEVSG